MIVLWISLKGMNYQSYGFETPALGKKGFNLRQVTTGASSLDEL